MIVEALCAGRPALIAGGKRSAIGKYPVEGPAWIGRLGLAGDTQVDKRRHGGPEMAMHIYPLTHYPFWRDQIGDHALLAEPGAFGSNLAVQDWDESQARVGERFRLGGVVLEVSQPRMPCATIERRFERKGMVAAILSSGRCGWYFRVIEEGEAREGDVIERVSNTGTEHTVREVFAALADPSGAVDPSLVTALSDCRELAAEWRAKAIAKLRRYPT